MEAVTLQHLPDGLTGHHRRLRAPPAPARTKIARQLLTDYADSPAYETTNWASMFDMPTHLTTITAPTLLPQGTAHPLISQQVSRYQALIPGAQLVWLPGLNHVPISDDPAAVAHHMLSYLRQVAPRAVAAA